MFDDIDVMSSHEASFHVYRQTKMPTTHTARNAPTFLNLPPEIRCMIYEEVFTRVRIILPARHALHRSEHLKSKLPSLLRVCRQCHVESSSILYSNAVMDVTASVTTETIDRALQNKNINLIKTLIVHGGYLKRMLGAHQKTRFPALEELIVRSDFVVLMFGGTGERSIRDVCRSEWAILMQQQANCGLDWSAHRGFSLHITFETYKGKSTVRIRPISRI